ncbi:MAG: alginate export family protein [Flavobacteriaceae bacterium]|nr:alginate export family protein [Flavobacteriaceae bacterium]
MKKLLLSTLLLAFSVVTLTAQQFDLSGEIRPRFESKNGYQTLLKPGEEGVSFISQRTRINLNYKQSNFLVRIALQNVRVWGDVSTLAASDKANAFHEAWAQFTVADYLDLKLGRQEIVYDDSRIFGNVGWAQQARSHDALIAKFKIAEKGKLDVGFALNNDTQAGVNYIYSNAAGYKTFQYAWYHTSFDNFGLSLLALNNGIEYLNGGVEEISYSQTLGSRATFKSGVLAFDAAFYLQSGNLRANKVNASYFGGNVKFKASNTLALGLGAEYLSGKDMNDASTDIKSFAPLFGTNHKFNGWMDYFYVGNHANSVGLVDFYATLAYKKDKFSAKLIPHLFSSAADIYNTGTKMSNKLGTEIDVTLGYKIAKNIQFNAGYSQMFGTKSLEVLKGGDSGRSTSWSWLMLTFKPNFYSSN